MLPKLRIGSRPSRLALAQASIVRRRLAAIIAGIDIEVVEVRTSGDKMTSASLAQVGGKGLFIKELEQALAARQIDIAIHSMKDLPAELPAQFRIAAVPERENTADALVTRNGAALDALPARTRLGTSSERRRMQALRINRALDVRPLRGNVDTRLTRLADGDLDAIIIAVAGLRRLGRDGDVKFVELDGRDFIPAGGQGALAVEALAERNIAGSAELGAAFEALNDRGAFYETAAERGFLAALGASCTTPVGVRAEISGSRLSIRAMLFSADGSREMTDALDLPVEPDLSPTVAAAAGAQLADRMIRRGADVMLAHSARE